MHAVAEVSTVKPLQFEVLILKHLSIIISKQYDGQYNLILDKYSWNV